MKSQISVIVFGTSFNLKIFLSRMSPSFNKDFLKILSLCVLICPSFCLSIPYLSQLLNYGQFVLMYYLFTINDKGKLLINSATQQKGMTETY